MLFFVCKMVVYVESNVYMKIDNRNACHVNVAGATHENLKTTEYITSTNHPKKLLFLQPIIIVIFPFVYY